MQDIWEIFHLQCSTHFDVIKNVKLSNANSIAALWKNGPLYNEVIVNRVMMYANPLLIV